MARGRGLNDETKASVIVALLAGQGVGEIAREYSLPRSTIYDIKKELEGNAPVAPSLGKAASSSDTSDKFGQVRTPNQRETPATGDMLSELISDYLRTSLKGLTAQAELFTDVNYLKRYPPQQLAILHGIMADKTARIIEAVSRASGREDSDEEGELGEADS